MGAIVSGCERADINWNKKDLPVAAAPVAKTLKCKPSEKRNASNRDKYKMKASKCKVAT